MAEAGTNSNINIFTSSRLLNNPHRGSLTVARAQSSYHGSMFLEMAITPLLEPPVM